MIESNSMDRDDSDIETEDYSETTRELLTLPNTHICDVWAHNFEEEMRKLSKMTERFNVIAMVVVNALRIPNFQASMSADPKYSASDPRKRLSTPSSAPMWKKPSSFKSA